MCQNSAIMMKNSYYTLKIDNNLDISPDQSSYY